MSAAEARARDYRPLTRPYRLPEEAWMLDRVVADMEQGGIEYAMVATASGPEVWRTTARMRLHY